MTSRSVVQSLVSDARFYGLKTAHVMKEYHYAFGAVYV